MAALACCSCSTQLKFGHKQPLEMSLQALCWHPQEEEVAESDGTAKHPQGSVLCGTNLPKELWFVEKGSKFLCPQNASSPI